MVRLLVCAGPTLKSSISLELTRLHAPSERRQPRGGQTFIPPKPMGSGVLDHDTINCCDQPERRRIRKLFARRPSHLTLNKMI